MHGMASAVFIHDKAGKPWPRCAGKLVSGNPSPA